MTVVKGAGDAAARTTLQLQKWADNDTKWAELLIGDDAYPVWHSIASHPTGIAELHLLRGAKDTLGAWKGAHQLRARWENPKFEGVILQAADGQFYVTSPASDYVSTTSRSSWPFVDHTTSRHRYRSETIDHVTSWKGTPDALVRGVDPDVRAIIGSKRSAIIERPGETVVPVDNRELLRTAREARA